MVRLSSLFPMKAGAHFFPAESSFAMSALVQSGYATTIS